jgi:circadian clock protein KaiC
MGKGTNSVSTDIDRVESGIAGLDSMINGGFPKNSSIILRGGSGTGKTILCLQYLYHGAEQYDEPGVFISFAESRKCIHEHARRFGWDLEKLEKKNKLAIIRYEPHEVMKVMDEGGGSIRDTVESIGTKRLVIDSISAYEMLFERSYKANESMLNLFELLRGWNTTTMVTAESPITPTMESRDRNGFLSDGILNMYYLRQGARRVRAVEVIKMRDTAHTDQVRKFTIGRNGITIAGGLSRIGRS